MKLWKEIAVLIVCKKREDLLVKMNMLHLGGDYFIIVSGIRKEWKGNNSLEEGLNHRIYFPLHLSWKLLKIKNSISWFISVLPTPPHSLPHLPFLSRLLVKLIYWYYLIFKYSPPQKYPPKNPNEISFVFQKNLIYSHRRLLWEERLLWVVRWLNWFDFLVLQSGIFLFLFLKSN